jgi:hypothetical protein
VCNIEFEAQEDTQYMHWLHIVDVELVANGIKGQENLEKCCVKKWFYS